MKRQLAERLILGEELVIAYCENCERLTTAINRLQDKCCECGAPIKLGARYRRIGKPSGVEPWVPPATTGTTIVKTGAGEFVVTRSPPNSAVSPRILCYEARRSIDDAYACFGWSFDPLTHEMRAYGITNDDPVLWDVVCTAWLEELGLA